MMKVGISPHVIIVDGLKNGGKNIESTYVILGFIGSSRADHCTIPDFLRSRELLYMHTIFTIFKPDSPPMPWTGDLHTDISYAPLSFDVISYERYFLRIDQQLYAIGCFKQIFNLSLINNGVSSFTYRHQKERGTKKKKTSEK